MYSAQAHGDKGGRWLWWLGMELNAGQLGANAYMRMGLDVLT